MKKVLTSMFSILVLVSSCGDSKEKQVDESGDIIEK